MPDRDAVLAALDVGVLVQRGSTQIIYANEAAHRLLGMSPDALLGMSSMDEVWDVIRPDGTPIQAVELPVPRAAASGVPVRGVVMGVCPPGGGHRRWLLADAIPQRGQDGAVDLVVCSLVDLTARRRQELLYRSVFRALVEGTIIYDAAGVAIDANPAAAAILGRPLAQIRGRSKKEVGWWLETPDGKRLSADDAPSSISQRDGVPIRGQRLVLVRPDQRRLLSVNTEPVFAERGDAAPRMVVTTFSDITEQDAAQVSLRDSHARFQRISDTVPGVMLEWSFPEPDRLRLEFSGGAGRHVLGLAVGDRLSVSELLERIHVSDRDAVRSAITSAQRDLAPIDMRARVQATATSPARWYHLRGTPVRSDGVLRMYMLLLDVDRRVRLAEAMRENQKRQTIGELTAGIAHNFNNMLAVILPNIEDAITRSPPALRPQLEDAVEATQNAAELVRQMLQLARRETVGAHSRVDLVAIITDALRITRQTFHPRIRLDFTPPEAPCWVQGSPGDLRQLLLNLLLNARDAVRAAGQPGIWLQISPVSRDGLRWWQLSVRDNGVGMDAATQERVGEPFFTTKGPTQGAGMGVATAMSIARDHGGTLRFVSAPGEGTTFTLALPQHEEAPAPALLPRRVLLIDDEALVRRVLVRTLHRRGIEVTEARDGAEGIALLEAEPQGFRAVLLDLSMPGMTGVAVFQRIRAINRQLPIIVITGDALAVPGLEAALAVLQKPIQSAQLHTLLERVFATR